jgi:hypothetical protein
VIEPKEKNRSYPEEVPIPNQCGAELTVQDRVRESVPRPDDDEVKRDSSGVSDRPDAKAGGREQFRYLATTTDRCKGAQLTDDAFWIHAPRIVRDRGFEPLTPTVSR